MIYHSGIYMDFTISSAAIVSFGGVTNDQKEEAKNHGLSIFSWEEFLIMVSFIL
jgi:hypothetical protein